MSGVCDIPVLSTVCQTAGQAAGTLVEAPFDWLAQAMGAAAGWLFEAVAVTVNVYAVPFVKPEMVWLIAVDANERDVSATPPIYGVTT